MSTTFTYEEDIVDSTFYHFDTVIRWNWLLYMSPAGEICFGQTKDGEIKYVDEWEKYRDYVLDIHKSNQFVNGKVYTFDIFKPYIREEKLNNLLWDTLDTMK